jgi:hypothetical protein
MDLKRQIGLEPDTLNPVDRDELIRHAKLRLAAAGYDEVAHDELFDEAHDLILNYREKSSLLSTHLCPADRRIQDFLESYFADTGEKIPSLPGQTFVLDRHGLAREMSLPEHDHHCKTPYSESYRIHQGVLHNPEHDRRTTKGSFHVVAGGLPVPDDKKEVPKITFLRLMKEALNPPKDALTVPFTQNAKKPLRSFISLLLRPVVVPEVKGFKARKSMEVRFFVPGSLIANLDFVESIFGNAGDPHLAVNDAGLDALHWTGHSGCVILAPHLRNMTKKDMGLPNIKHATDRQKRDGMCWTKPSEKYNDGVPFKLTCRDERGIVVTLIADSYFGYCKKEVKTQISMSANLFGYVEEEHAGGAIAFPAFHLGDTFEPGNALKVLPHRFKDVVKALGDKIIVKKEGYAVDKLWPSLIYVPETAQITVSDQSVTWKKDGKKQSIPLLREHTYMYPTGYKVRLERHPGAKSWRLVGVLGEGTFCHKPCTVSGGGKSEISKSFQDAFLYRSFFIRDWDTDMAMAEEIINRNYSDRFKPEIKVKRRGRALLSPERSLGSVIKLLTQSASEYTKEYNDWLETIPDHIRALVYVIKRFYDPDSGNHWKDVFSVDMINGRKGIELKYRNRALVTINARVGYDDDHAWRTFKLRQDFIAADKLQMEDDITASIVAPPQFGKTYNVSSGDNSLKFLENCEYRFFQRPDDAVIPGYDKQAEKDIAADGTFGCNYEPLTRQDALNMVTDTIGISEYTDPMRERLEQVAASPKDDDRYFICTSQLRKLSDGSRTANPRYLQPRPDVVDPRHRYISEMGTRLRRQLKADQPIGFPVNAVLCGRRNNPADKAAGIRALAVYNPIHYQELPELFMDFICSLTGKSPSTTGAGSEGALTKGPFNCLPPIVDMNNALVSYILTGHQGFSSSAGFLGTNVKVDHDISLLIPELWCRMDEEERDPEYLKSMDFLEKLDDFVYEGKLVHASRLGYRITSRFARYMLGRIFDTPMAVFTDEMIKPELQDMDSWVDGIHNITEAQERVAKGYFNDGSIHAACPPLKALLHIMAYGEYEGKTVHDKSIRDMFTRESLLNSDWYEERLKTQQARDIARWKRHVDYLTRFIEERKGAAVIKDLSLRQQLKAAQDELSAATSSQYLRSIRGSLGADPLHGFVAEKH